MSFRTIINSYISQINAGKSRYESMSHVSPSSTIAAVNLILNNAANAIESGIDSMFDDPDITSGSKLNFLILNGYSEAFKEAESWHVGPDNFTLEPNYYQCRGLFYRLADIGTAGRYLSNYSYAVSNCVQIMANFQDMYNIFVMPPEGVSKLDEFWLVYAADFNTQMISAIDIFDTLKNDFLSIPGLVNSYKELAEAVNMSIAIGNTFIESINKEASSGTILSQSFANIGSSFVLYNNSIQQIYNIHIQSITENQNSKNYPPDTYNTNLKRIQKAKILNFALFFNISTSIHNSISNLISKYS
jgi:hypothetical protein